MGQDYFANLAKTNTTKSDAKHCGGQITLHKCAKPEMRIFIRDNTRQFKAATFSDSAIRGNCARSYKKFYYEVGATVVKPHEVRYLAKKSNYDKIVSKYLKEYDRLIAESSTLLSFEGKEIIRVSKFTELLDIHDNVQLPIMYYEITKHELSYFYISHSNTIYLFEVHNEEKNY